jgi:predicted lipoprotein with Yx(FWY)xxD motif
MHTPPGADRDDESARTRSRSVVRWVVAPLLLALSAAAVPASAGATTSPQVSVAKISGVGNVLVFGHRALYVHTGDTTRHSTCTGVCAVAWPPLLVSSRSAHHLGRVHGLGTFRRANGRIQVTIKGQPLYFFAADKTLTSAKGQGFANVFWTVRSNGTVVHVKPVAAPAPALPVPTSTSSTSGTQGTQPPMAPAPTSPPPTSPPPTAPPTTTTTSPPPTTTTTVPSGGGVSF